MASFFDGFKTYAKPVTDLDLKNRPNVLSNTKKQCGSVVSYSKDVGNFFSSDKEKRRKAIENIQSRTTSGKTIDDLLRFNGIKGVKSPVKPLVIELDIYEAPPPFTLLINPSEFVIRYAIKISESRVRWVDASDSGYIFQAHHDELDTISMNGVSALFYDDGGLTSDNREISLAWENINQLLAIYRNNGLNYNNKITQNNNAMINSVGNVLITYDGCLFKGNFLNFNINENDSKPFNYDFSFEFKVVNVKDTNKLLEEEKPNYTLLNLLDTQQQETAV